MNHFEWRDPNETIARNLRDVGLDPGDARFRHFVELWARIQDLPRHLGQHSGGMVICQGRLDEVVPLEPASMPGRVVVQWDKDDCADLGLVKVDLLGLGMMAVLQDALAIVNRSTSPPVDLAHLPPDDPEVYHLLQTADTIGALPGRVAGADGDAAAAQADVLLRPGGRGRDHPARADRRPDGPSRT